jgi:predicted phage terminase large subunit-like protein
MASDVDEVLLGGAAGGGKSSAEIALPLRWCNHPRFRALILRREMTQLQDLLDKADDLYPREYPGVRWRGDENSYTFPSGAVVRFGHCKDSDDWEKYAGWEMHLLCFDELTHFLFKQYREITKRVRSSVPELPRYVRSASNPGSVGHAWVFKRWAPWLDPECVLEDWTATLRAAAGAVREVRGTGLPARPGLPPAAGGQALWVVQTPQGERFSSTPVEGFPRRTFVPSKLTDNPRLTEADPLYENKLLDNDPVRVAQLRDGNWLVKPAAGLYFRREFFEIVDAAPMDGPCARVWDLAATEPSSDNPDPDWTVGLLGSKSADGYFYLEDLKRDRLDPGGVRALVLATAREDGVAVPCRVPRDPGQAGKDQAAQYHQLLEGFDIQTRVVTGSKATRWSIASAQASPHSTGGLKGRIRVVRGDWNDELFDELEALPTGSHDDIADTLADLIAELSSGGSPEVSIMVIGDDAPPGLPAPTAPLLLPAVTSSAAVQAFGAAVQDVAARVAGPNGWASAEAVWEAMGIDLTPEQFGAALRAAGEQGAVVVRGDEVLGFFVDSGQLGAGR